MDNAGFHVTLISKWPMAIGEDGTHYDWGVEAPRVHSTEVIAGCSQKADCGLDLSLSDFARVRIAGDAESVS